MLVARAHQDKRPKDYQIILPVQFKATLQDKTIALITKREEAKAVLEAVNTPTKSANDEK